MSRPIYNKYSDFLFNKYNAKVYKLPVNIPSSCPNRDGTITTGGCSFCSPIGVAYESLSEKISVKDQLLQNREYISQKYKATKFIAYFQNYSNTYLDFEDFKKYMIQAAESNICEIAVSTRPDVLFDKHILFLKEISKTYDIDITIELGLQTANYHTLKKVNRGHGLSEFIDACLRINRIEPNINICAHVILNLPYDNMLDTIETSRILSVLKVNYVKLHALYLMEGCKMADEYKKGDFTIISSSEYIDRVILFLEHLSPYVYIQRLIGRNPKEGSVFSNWGMSWRKIQNKIERIMIENNYYQGSKSIY